MAAETQEDQVQPSINAEEPEEAQLVKQLSMIKAKSVVEEQKTFEELVQELREEKEKKKLI